MVPEHREPQTSLIDQTIVQQVKRKMPKVLFIPTASEDNAGYCEAFRNQYEKRLGCSVQELLLHSGVRSCLLRHILILVEWRHGQAFEQQGQVISLPD